MGRLAAIIFALCALLGWLPEGAIAQSMPGARFMPGPPPAGPLTCGTVARADFSQLTDAVTQIKTAKLVAANGAQPEQCVVDGYVSPSVSFRIWLPTAASWNGKYIQTGCGGYCSDLITNGCELLAARGYACLAADMGHKSTTYDLKWAYNDLAAKLDFGYRATHVAALAGKAITTSYYGRTPTHAYHIGASQGGRQGVVAAQRFPWDFDGVVAGEPSLYQAGLSMLRVWNAMALTDKEGRALVGPADLALVNRAAVAACDMDDRVKDGLISDPRRCRFDPAVLICRAGQATGCLTPIQAAAVAKVYGGPINSKGERLTTGSALPGSELHWIDAYITADGGVGRYSTNVDAFRYLLFPNDPGPTWRPTDFDWDEDYKRFGMSDPILSGMNPDFRPFKQAGGKMIIYMGWNDEAVFPQNAVDLYETAERVVGGREAAQAFLRLFMIPGQGHLPTGNGAESLDYLTYLEDWVERGKAPDVLIGAHLKTKQGAAGPILYPGDFRPDNFDFSRPIYPYPVQARYRGGDPNQASSFGPYDPTKPKS